MDERPTSNRSGAGSSPAGGVRLWRSIKYEVLSNKCEAINTGVLCTSNLTLST